MKYYTNKKTNEVFSYESAEDAKLFNSDFKNLVEMNDELLAIYQNRPLGGAWSIKGWIIDEKLKNEEEALIHKSKVPQKLSRFQALTVLKLTKTGNDSLFKLTNDYINSLNDDTIENITIKTAWETAQEFQRDSKLISTAQQLFKLTDEQVDEMFIQGAEIKV